MFIFDRGRSRVVVFAFALGFLYLIYNIATLQKSSLQDTIAKIPVPGKPKDTSEILPSEDEESQPEQYEPDDAHPISRLMAEADKKWKEYDEVRSMTFKQTVARYRIKYGRHPPPGFKDWYMYARKRNVHHIDDFEQIMDDLRPFWGVQPGKLRRLAAHAWEFEQDGCAGIHIRNGKIVKENNPSWRSSNLITMIEPFVEYLPDMDIAMNRMDQPRVVVPWEDMQNLLTKEKTLRMLPPEVDDTFTAHLPDLLNVELTREEDNSTREDPKWFSGVARQFMDFAKEACPPESRANGGSLLDAEKTYKDRSGGVISNFNLSTDLCTVGPEIQEMHGYLFSASSNKLTNQLFPVFGECKVNVNSDILFPANMYWMHDVRYDYNNTFDVEWDDKKDIALWRGVTSGGVGVPETWRNMHRQRLVLLANGTEMLDKNVRILMEQPEKKGDYENFRQFKPSDFANKYMDIGFTEAWGCIPNCSHLYDNVYSWKEQVPLPEQFKHKYLIDVDGHSFSGRWRAFLQSRSLGIKATIFREWHDSRLFGWRHFVPMDNRFDDLYTILTYFLGVGRPEDRRAPGEAYVARHNEEARRIAQQGREWAGKVLRRDDIEIYMFRLLLEYGRIIDDNRDRIGYSGDGSELDKYDSSRDSEQADTLDLQDQEQPSAKDHSRQPSQLNQLGEGPPGPHQASALKNANLDAIEHHPRSPRLSQDLSGKELSLLSDDSHEGLDGIGGDSGMHGEDGMDDEDGDNDMDDDLMDKISSSPSIDDGGYYSPYERYPTNDQSTSFSPVSSQKESNFLSKSRSPNHLALHYTRKLHQVFTDSTTPLTSPMVKNTPSEVHHPYRGYSIAKSNEREGDRDLGGTSAAHHADMQATNRSKTLKAVELAGLQQDLGDSFELDDLHNILTPENDPLLDNDFDDVDIDRHGSCSPTSSSSTSSSFEERDMDTQDDETEDISLLNHDSRFIDSGWGGECLREIEDIDFEFVYALHTFAATVEGQANATKGDTMVLLDDSNSYWWLVRVVKDSSIGYLPAEHIETPTERLARLNKHRNIDLSQTMLGDSPEKSRNPVKKAMKRRKAKTVQFAPPTYHEAAEIDYSSDEEEPNDALSEFLDNGIQTQAHPDEEPVADVIAPLNTLKREPDHSDDIIEQDNEPIQSEPKPVTEEPPAQVEQPRTSDDVFDQPGDDFASRTRKGLVRNTDSFFKDDSVETRKINLTPALFRDDSNTNISSEPKEQPRTKSSFDAPDKSISSPEKSKDDKRKDKKSGVLGGLFKRRDRKSKQQNEGDDPEWLSKQISNQSPQSKVSMESLTPSQENQPAPGSPQQQRQQPQRQTSKLQKTPPAKQPPLNKSTSGRDDSSLERLNGSEPTNGKQVNGFYHATDDATNPVNKAADGPSRPIITPINSTSQEPKSPDTARAMSPPTSPTRSRAGMFSPIRDVLRSSSNGSESKPLKTRLLKQRMPLDEFDASPIDNDPEDQRQQRLSEDQSRESDQLNDRERLSESPIHVPPFQEASQPSHPPALVGDTSSQEDPSAEMVSPASTPELVDAPQVESIRDEETPTSAAPRSVTTPSWSDASLRTYLEDDSEIRDLLVVVHDKSGIQKVDRNHPLVTDMCQDQNRRLGDMSTRLDGLLQDLLSRRARTPVT
ncbi:hypothetical protein MMC25_003757 [Agyrium rufum]|nr:hypothetical protein [Agyrium rufum]